MSRGASVEIGLRTLYKAITGVSTHVRELRTILGDDTTPEQDQMIEEWEDAARELEEAYNAASRKVLNLPPYDQLIVD